PESGTQVQCSLPSVLPPQAVPLWHLPERRPPSWMPRSVPTFYFHRYNSACSDRSSSDDVFLSSHPHSDLPAFHQLPSYVPGSSARQLRAPDVPEHQTPSVQSHRHNSKARPRSGLPLPHRKPRDSSFFHAGTRHCRSPADHHGSANEYGSSRSPP